MSFGRVKCDLRLAILVRIRGGDDVQEVAMYTLRLKNGVDQQ